jgi:hypothetical protein
MADTFRSMFKNNPVALGIAAMPRDRRWSYARGIIAREEKITPQEYAALKAAEAADGLPGTPMTYGRSGRREIDSQLPSAVADAYNLALQQANDGKVKEYNFGSGESVGIATPPKERSILGRMLGKNW